MGTRWWLIERYPGTHGRGTMVVKRDTGTHYGDTLVVNRERPWNPQQGYHGGEKKDTLEHKGV
jgi:hypothetical protein